MTHLVRIASRFAALSLVAPCAFALQAPLVVDDDGGPGVDHTEIQDAIDAATTFGVIVVRAGDYTGPLDIDRPVRIVADDDVRLLGSRDVVIEDVDAGLPVAVSGLANGNVRARRCDATLIFEGDRFFSLDEARECADVRTNGLSVHYVIASRVEAVGVERYLHPTSLTQGALVHFIDSTIEGTPGSSCQTPTCYAGDGGPGLYMNQSTAVLTRSTVRGGDGGYGWHWNDWGYGGVGLQAVDSHVRLSESAILPGEDPWGSPAQAFSITNTTLHYVDAATPDPSLRIAGQVVPGGNVRFVVRGTVTEYSRLYLGRSPVVTPVAGSPIEKLTSQERAAGLSPIPAAGEQFVPFTVPASYPVGTIFYVQASASDASGQPRFTNSAPFIVR